jgi:drug/metabolite transporter (DMT)-like permease
VSRNAKIWIALWTVYIVWGSTYLGIELAAETMPPFFAAGVRFLIAGLLMLAIVAWRRGSGVLRLTKAEAAASAVVGLLLPGANALLFVTERQVPIGLASLIIASIPLWVVLLRLAAHERPDLVSVAGLVVGFAGIALLVRPGGDSGSLGYLLLTVLGAFMWAFGSFLSPRLPVPRDAFAATAYEMLAGGAVLMAIALVVYSPHEFDPANYSARSIFGLAYLIVFGSLVGYSAYAWLLANAPLQQVSTYAYVNPVIAIALGAIVLGESITWRIVGGALLIIAAVAIVVRRESKEDVAVEGAGFSGTATVPESVEPDELVGENGHPRSLPRRGLVPVEREHDDVVRPNRNAR